MAVEEIRTELVPEDDELRKSLDEAQQELDEITDKARKAQTEARKAQQEFARANRQRRSRMGALTGQPSAAGRIQLSGEDFVRFENPMAKVAVSSGKALIALHGIGKALNVGADIQAAVAEARATNPDVTTGELLRTAGGKAAESFARSTASLFGVESIVRGIMRNAVGDERANKEIERFYKLVFNTQESIEREKEERERAEAQLRREIDQSIAEAFGQLDSQLPKSFRFKFTRDLNAYRRIIKNRNRDQADAVKDYRRSKLAFEALKNNEGH